MSEVIDAEIKDEGSTSEQVLLDFLAKHDASCPACGYNLRMLNKPVCPECGLPIKLTVGSDSPFKRAWAIALCLSAMIAGIGVVFALLGFVAGEPPPGGMMTLFWFYVPMLWIPAPLILFGLRSRFCRMQTSLQYLVVGLIAVLLVIIGVTMLMSL